MEKIGASEREFVAQRRTMSRRWKPVGWILIAIIAAALGFLFLTSPMLVDPFETLSRIKTDSIPDGTLRLMAAMLPVVFLGCFLLLVVFVIFQFQAMANERRFIEIIDSLVDDGES